MHALKKKKKKKQRGRFLVPNMAESRSWCGHPGSGHWGALGCRRALTLLQRDAGLAERHKEDPNTIWQNPTFHPARQGSQIRQQNPSFEGPERRRVFLARAEWQIPRQARCGARARSAPRAALCASARAGGGPKPTSGGPRPTTGAAFPTVPGRAGQCVAPASGSRAWARRTSGGLGRRPRPRPALPTGPGLWAPSCPREQAGPSPGAGPRQARPAWRAPASRWQVRLGRAGVTPARTGTQRLLPRDRGRRLQEATGWSPVRELSWSGLAAGRLKGVHSGGSLLRCSHQAAVAAAASDSAGCACACVPVSGRVGVCVQRLAFTIYTKGWEEAGKGRAWGRWRRKGSRRGAKGYRRRRRQRRDR